MNIEKLKLIINIISRANIDLNSDRAMIIAIKLNRLEVNKKFFKRGRWLWVNKKYCKLYINLER